MQKRGVGYSNRDECTPAWHKTLVPQQWQSAPYAIFTPGPSVTVPPSTWRSCDVPAKIIGGEEEPTPWKKTYKTQGAAAWSGDELWHMTLAEYYSPPYDTSTPRHTAQWMSLHLEENSCTCCIDVSEVTVEKCDGCTEKQATVLQPGWTKDTSPWHRVIAPRHWATLTKRHVTGPPIAGPVAGTSPLHVLFIGKGGCVLWRWKDENKETAACLGDRPRIPQQH